MRTTSNRKVRESPVGGDARCDLQHIEARTPARHRAAMSRAQCLKCMFKLDVESCEQCGGAVKVSSLLRISAPATLVNPFTSSPCIEGPALVKRILDHLEQYPGSGARRRALSSL